MSNRRWSKFWWQDWQGDAALRICSLAAQGLWMRLLCVAHEGVPYGHVTIGGLAPSLAEIAALCGTSEKDVKALLAQLEGKQVFSRTEAGVIYSRRMVKDYDASENGREAIAKRWDKSTKPNSGNGSPPNSKPTNDPNRVPGSPDTEADTERKIQPTAASKAAAPPDARAELWNEGLTTLRGLTGQPDPAMRRLLGKLLKSAHDDCALVLVKIRTAADLRPAEPVAWLTAAIGHEDNADARLLAAAGLTPAGIVIDGEATEIQPRFLQ